MEPMLKVNDLVVNYGYVEALRGVSLEVNPMAVEYFKKQTFLTKKYLKNRLFV